MIAVLNESAGPIGRTGSFEDFNNNLRARCMSDLQALKDGSFGELALGGDWDAVACDNPWYVDREDQARRRSLPVWKTFGAQATVNTFAVGAPNFLRNSAVFYALWNLGPGEAVFAR
jgi:hypothetical protein